MSEKRCRNCGGLLEGDNAGCLACGVVRTPTLPNETETSSSKPDFDTPNFVHRAWQAILPSRNSRTRLMNYVFVIGWIGTTLVMIMNGIDEGQRTGRWSSLFVAPFVGLLFALLLMVASGFLGALFLADEDDQPTVAEVLAKRQAKARKKKKQQREPTVPSTPEKESAPADNVKPAPDSSPGQQIVE